MEDASTFFDESLKQLSRASVERSHQMREVVLSTTLPSARILILRNFEQENHTLLFYTDSRTQKCAEIKEMDSVHLLAYDDKKRLQIRMSGKAKIITSGPTFETHKEKALTYSRDYSSILKPSTTQETNEVSFGQENYFCLIEIRVDSYDVLKLQKPYHLRVKAYREAFDARWVTP